MKFDQFALIFNVQSLLFFTKELAENLKNSDQNPRILTKIRRILTKIPDFGQNPDILGKKLVFSGGPMVSHL